VSQSPTTVFADVSPAEASYEAAAFAVLSVPFEATTTYVKGTREAPRRIIEASTNVELYDEELQQETHKAGIATLPALSAVATYDDMQRSVAEAVRALLADGKTVVALGGEHSITIPLVEEHKRRFPKLSVLQIDAHADMRDEYFGDSFSHACAMRRIADAVRITQVGIRAVSAEEAPLLNTDSVRTFFAAELQRNPRWIAQVVETLSADVYITIDADGVDPSILPAVGTPEPGGLTWYQTLDLLRAVAAKRNVVGFDFVELCPQAGSILSDFVAAKVCYKLIGYIAHARKLI